MYTKYQWLGVRKYAPDFKCKIIWEQKESTQEVQLEMMLQLLVISEQEKRECIHSNKKQ